MKKVIFLFLIVLFLIVSFLSTIVDAQLMDSGWTKYNNDLNNSGQSQYSANTNGGIKWNYTYISGDEFNKLVVDKNGTIYIGTFDGNLSAFYPNGSLKWIYTTNTGFRIRSSPAIDSDGTIYFGTYDSGDYEFGDLYALYPNGSLKWNYSSTYGIGNAFSKSPSIGTNGIIYAGSYGAGTGNFHAIYPNGTEYWGYSASGAFSSSPAIDSDGIIYADSLNGNLYAFYPNGSLKWTYLVDSLNETSSSPAIDSNGIIYTFAETNDTLHAIYPNGTMKWSSVISAGSTIQTSPSIDNDGNIYVSLNNGLYSLYSNGTVRWSYIVDYPNSPIIDNNGIIYFSDTGGNFYSLYNNGTLKWSTTLGVLAGSTPDGGETIIDSKGVIYTIATNADLNSVLYAFSSPFFPYISSPINNSRHWNNSINFTWNGTLYDNGDSDGSIYDFWLSSQPDFSNTINRTNYSNNWTGNIATTDGVTYYGKVRSYDGYEYSNWSNVIQFTENTAPSVPSLVQHSNYSTLESTCVNWTISSDNESDTLTYDVKVYNTTTGLLIINQTGTSNNYSQSFITANFTIYNYTARAYDGYEYSAWATALEFSFIDVIAPTLINESISSQSVQQGFSNTITASFSDEAAVSSATVRVENPDGSASNWSMTCGTGATVICTKIYTSTVLIGTYYVRSYYPQDNSNNVANISSTKSFEVTEIAVGGGTGGSSGGAVFYTEPVAEIVNKSVEVLKNLTQPLTLSFVNVTSGALEPQIIAVQKCLTESITMKNECSNYNYGLLIEPQNYWIFLAPYAFSGLLVVSIGLSRGKKRQWITDPLVYGTIVVFAVAILTLGGFNIYILNYIFNNPKYALSFLTLGFYGLTVGAIGDYLGYRKKSKKGEWVVL